jgi:hypothetical protein
MQNYNFAFSFAWVCNLVSDIKERTWIKGIENKMLRRIFGSKRSFRTSTLRQMQFE